MDTTFAPTRAAGLDLLAGAGLPFRFAVHDYERRIRPHATAGVFKVRKRMPEILGHPAELTRPPCTPARNAL